MAVDVSKIPNNNKFDPVREAILELDAQIGSGGGGTINNGILTIDTLVNLTGGGTFSANQAANTNISIGITSNPTFTSVTTDTLQFTGGTGTQGTLSWNADEATIDIIQNGSTLQVGQETQVHVKNQTGSTIPDGTPVYVTGTLGASGRLTVAPMIADNSIPAKYFLGVTTESISDGEDGKVTTFGKIRGLDTTAYTEGQTLYVSSITAGAWQTTPPTSPDLDLEVAIVINIHANNGTIFVRATNGQYLGLLHDVNLTTLSDEEMLVYNSVAQRWENQDISSITSINLDTVTTNGSTTSNSITIGGATVNGSVTANSFVKDGGTQSKFLKADGSTTELTVTTNPTAFGSGALLYSTLTGELEYTPPDLSVYLTSGDISDFITLTDLSVLENTANEGGSLSYSDTTGVFEYTPPDLSSFLTSYTETSDLSDVIGRGNTTDSYISFTGNGTDTGIRFNNSVVANDAAGIRQNGTSNAGELEFFTTDDDNEPFVFRHYTTGQDGSGASAEWFRIGASGNVTATGIVTASGGNSTQWNTAYGWGDHADAGYLTSLPSHNHDTRYLRKDVNDTSTGNLTVNEILRVRNDLGNIASIRLAEDTANDHVILEYDGTGSGLTNYFHMYSNVTNWATKGDSFNMQPQTGNVNIGGLNFDYKFRVEGTTYFNGAVTANGSLTATDNIEFSGRLLRESNSTSDTINIRAGSSGQYLRLMGGEGGLGVADSQWSHTLQIANYGSDNGSYASIYHNSSLDIRLGDTNAKSDIVMFKNLSMGIPGNGTNNDGRFISLEGSTDASGEGSGRLFFTEHNSTTASMDKYGMSIGYRGGATTITGASGNEWTGLSSIGNGQWGMWGHNNDATGDLIMYGDRQATFVDFAGNTIQGASTVKVGTGGLILDRVTGSANIKGGSDGHIVIDPSDASHDVYLSHYTAGNVYLANAGGSIYIGASNNSGRLYSDDWGIKAGTDSGYIQLGPANTSWAHIYTDRPAFYFNQDLYVNGKLVYHSGNLASHNHDDRYYTETEIQTFFDRGYLNSVSKSNLAVGWYTIATNSGNRALGEFQIWDTASSDHQSVLFNASHHFGVNNSNDITVLANSRYSGTNFRYIRIKDGGTYDGAALQVYIDGSSNSVRAAIVGGNAQESGWVLKDFIPDATDPGVPSYGQLSQRCIVDLDKIINGGIMTTGAFVLSHPSDSADTIAMYVDSLGNFLWGADTSSTAYMFLHKDGMLGINGVIPSHELTVKGNSYLDGSVGINTTPSTGSGGAALKVAGGTNGYRAIELYGAAYSSVGYITFPTLGSGIAINSTAQTGASAFTFQYNGSTVGRIAINSSSTSYVTTSDYRIKENLVDITDGIDRIKLLKPKRFNFIGEDLTVDGFVAHEAQEVVPEAVTGEKDGVDYNGDVEYQGIDQSKLVPLLTAALQEAINKIEALEARVSALENN